MKHNAVHDPFKPEVCHLYTNSATTWSCTEFLIVFKQVSQILPICHWQSCPKIKFYLFIFLSVYYTEMENNIFIYVYNNKHILTL